MLENLRVGIPMLGNASWLGGVTYVELLLRSLRRLPADCRPRLCLIVPHWNLASAELSATNRKLADEVIYWGPDAAQARVVLGTETTIANNETALFSHIDFFYPAASQVLPGRCAASWIPDFQHRYLPHFFSAAECEERDRTFARIAAEARIVVFSSAAVRDDFRRFHPDSRAQAFLLRFFNPLDPAWLAGDPKEAQARHGLPDRFLICCNQFWAHKNHQTLIRALGRLQRQGISIHLVCTGPTEDYRAPGHLDKLRRLIASEGISDLVHILGILPRAEQMQLMRRAMAIVQPSLFEGWSTVVEDGRSLGKPMFLSDIAVHREQAPRNSVYFPPEDDDALARLVAATLPDLAPGPIAADETRAVEETVSRAEIFARDFCILTLASILDFRGVPAGANALPPSVEVPIEKENDHAKCIRAAMECCALGEARIAENDLAGAVRLFELAAALDLPLARPLNNLGAVSWQLAEKPAALEFFRRGALAQPDDWNVTANLVSALKDGGRPDEARHWLTRYLAIKPNDREALDALAQLS
jgi:glycosyltransferase involved in cell wall biosynthesis